MELFGFVSLLILTVLHSVTQNTEATVCKTNSECGNDECCYIKPEFEIVSRRRQASILPIQPVHHDTGVCERYRVEHEPCGPLEKANGHCGCGPGLTCKFVPAEIVTAVLPTAQLITRRDLSVNEKRSIYLPGPGTIQCEKP